MKLQTILKHNHTERTSRNRNFGLFLERLRDPVIINFSSYILFHPHPATAGTATETAFMMTIHLDQFHSRNLAQNFPRLGINIIVTSEIAGVMINHFGGQRLFQANTSFINQLFDELSMVDNIIVTTQLLVIFFQGIITMRTHDDDVLDSVTVQSLNIFHRQGLVEVFVTQLTG